MESGWLISSILLLLFTIFFIYPLLIESRLTVSTKADKMSLFDDVIEGKRLVQDDSALTTISIFSQKDCALACNRNSTCRSFNFCGRRTCELNAEDVFSTEQGEDLLKDDPKCKYFGMKRNETPVCRELEENVDIKIDQENGKCQISGKRVDREWGEWELVSVIDRSTEWKYAWVREPVSDVAHGGNPGSEENEKDPEYWIRWVNTKKPWAEARLYCASLGGTLFYKFDGTREQLELFDDHSDGLYYTGFLRDGSTNNWRNLEGDLVSSSLFHWASNQPVDKPEYSRLALQTHFIYSMGFSDEKQARALPSMCDINV